METRDPGYRGNRCRENVSLPGQAGPAPGKANPCSRAGNTPHHEKRRRKVERRETRTCSKKRRLRPNHSKQEAVKKE